MLNMGFKESVQNILAAAKGVTDLLQTMLFSATKPAWVKSLEDSFLRKVTLPTCACYLEIPYW